MKVCGPCQKKKLKVQQQPRPSAPQQSPQETIQAPQPASSKYQPPLILKPTK